MKAQTILVTVKGAKYLDTVDGIAMLLLDEKTNKEYQHILYSNEYNFQEGQDRETEMIKLATLMGKDKKTCTYTFDEDIEEHKTKAIENIINNWKAQQ